MKEAKEVIAKRIAEIQVAIEQARTNHSVLLGHLGEAQFMLQSIFKEECEAKAETSDATEVSSPEVGA